MYKKILVPLDGSERAERIFPHVLNLCGAQQGKVILLHVLDPSPSFVSAATIKISPDAADQMVGVGDVLERTRTQGHDYLKCKQSELEAKGVHCEIVVEQGGVVERIAQVAEDKSVDLVAISSHGRTGFSRAFFGSVAAGVLHLVEHPLLIVRSSDKP